MSAIIILAIWAFSSGVFILFLGLFVYLRNKKSLLNQVFALLTLGQALWLIPYGFWNLAEIIKDEAAAIFFSKLLMVGGTFFCAFYFYWILVFLNLHQKYKKLLVFNFAVSVIFAYVSLFTSLMVKGVRPILEFPYWPQAGPALIFFMLYAFGLVGVGTTYLLLRNYRTFSGYKKEQIKYLMLALLLYCTAFFNIPQWYGVSIRPYPTFLFSLYPLVLAYAMTRHRLMDIRLVVGRGAVYFLTIGTIVALGFIFTFLNINLAPLALQNVFNILAFVAAALIFPLILDFWQKVAGKYFYSAFYSFKEVLMNLRESTTKVLDLGTLSSQIANALKNTLKLDEIGILILSKKEKKYFSQSLMGFKEKEISGLLEDNVLADYLTITKDVLISDEILTLLNDPRVLQKQKESLKILKEKTEGMETVLFLPLLIENDLIAIIILGEKVSGAFYTREDISLLSTFSPQLAIALNNAILYQEIKERKEDLERFYSLTVGRELKMIELKKKIKELEEEKK